MVGELQSSMDLAKSDKGGTVAPSIPLGFYEPLKHVCATSPSVILGGATSKARGVVSVVLDAH